MDTNLWAEEIAGRIYEKEKKVVGRNSNIIPYTTENGRFDDWSGEDRICWWTNGFWAGMLWQLYHAFRDESFKQEADRIERKLDQNLMNYMGMDHDSGFKWLLTSGAHMLEEENEASRNRLMLAAGNLAGRINLASGLIRAWNDPGDAVTTGWAIIDCMMNLPLLYKAGSLIRDPRFEQIAKCHADHAREVFVREDGSVNHIVTFDPQTGEFTGTRGGQGMGEGTSWTRGQAWAIYGFALSYRHTGEKAYLETSKKVADYVISKLPESGLVPVDYCQPVDCNWEDDTAAAITACGLLELGKQLGSDTYIDVGVRLLRTLAESCCNWDFSADHLLEKCSAAYHDERHNFPIIYGDYFFTEGILKLCGKELFMW